jgi:transcriptional regulator with XRE-family HTH domain
MSAAMDTPLPEIIVGWRRQQGLNQTEAAARIGVAQPVLSRIEGGSRIPDRDTARLFVDAGVFTAEEYGRALIAAVVGEKDAA